jgi:hypothetical protein
MANEEVEYEAHYFNSLDSFSLLMTVYLSKFDLVIWQTSNDGTQLSLWNKNDPENSHLKAYLNQGGKLWIGGLDFLFDKYGAAPKTFSEGEFAYEYLGLNSYDVQTYGA